MISFWKISSLDVFPAYEWSLQEFRLAKKNIIENLEENAKYLAKDINLIYGTIPNSGETISCYA